MATIALQIRKSCSTWSTSAYGACSCHSCIAVISFKLKKFITCCIKCDKLFLSLQSVILLKHREPAFGRLSLNYDMRFHRGSIAVRNFNYQQDDSDGKIHLAYRHNI